MDATIRAPGGILSNPRNSTTIPQILRKDSRYPRAAYDFVRAQLTENAYKGPMSKLGAGPEAVAKAISGALKARRPKPRYLVTASAHLMVNQRRLVPDRVWDRMMRTQFPTPEA